MTVNVMRVQSAVKNRFIVNVIKMYENPTEFKLHQFLGAGHVAFAFLRLVRLFGGKYIYAIDREIVDNRNCKPYCLNERYGRNYSAKHQVMKRLSETLGLEVKGRNVAFDDVRPRKLLFLNNMWLLADSHKATVESLVLCHKSLEIDKSFNEHSIPQYTRIMTSAVDVESLSFMCKISIIEHDEEDGIECFKEKTHEQILKEIDVYKELKKERKGQSVSCGAHNHSMLTLAIPELMSQLLWKYGNVEGVYYKQKEIESG